MRIEEEVKVVTPLSQVKCPGCFTTLFYQDDSTPFPDEVVEEHMLRGECRSVLQVVVERGKARQMKFERAKSGGRAR